MVDFERQKLVFPPEIYGTSERPHIVIWSVSSNTVIMIELTCPSEEGFEAASVRKHNRYEDLVQNIRLQEWNPVLMTVEVGARGYEATSMLRCLHRLGFSHREVRQLRKAFAQVAARYSYGIYLSRKNVHACCPDPVQTGPGLGPCSQCSPCGRAHGCAPAVGACSGPQSSQSRCPEFSANKGPGPLHLTVKFTQTERVRDSLCDESSQWSLGSIPRHHPRRRRVNAVLTVLSPVDRTSALAAG